MTVHIAAVIYLDFYNAAEVARNRFMDSQSLTCGIPVTVSRQSLFGDVLLLYQQKEQHILQMYPLQVKFRSERGVDAGGLTRDMFSGFFQEAYKKLFDGSALLCPVVHPGMNMSTLTTLGRVISHAYLVTGLLPTRISFPCLAQILLGQIEIPDDVLFHSFVDNISSHEADIIRRAMNEVAMGVKCFSSSLQSDLVSALSRFNIRVMPIPDNFRENMINIARYELISKPLCAVQALSSGIPSQHRSFWQSISLSELLSIYRAQSVSRSVTLKMFQDAEGRHGSEARILCYLRQYIGNMSSDELSTFLRFVTGAATCSALKVSVIFNGTTGCSRRPIVHTCGPVLELSTSYQTYNEFVEEFRSCLQSEYAWITDSV